MARPKGSKNKKTLDREERARAELAARDLERMPGGVRRKLAKEKLEDLADIFAGQAAHYQNAGWRSVQNVDGRVGKANNNPNYNEESYRYWTAMYKDTLRDLAPYQSPRLSAVAVGTVTKMVVIVKGGLPPRDTSDPAPAIAAPAIIDVVPTKPDAA